MYTYPLTPDQPLSILYAIMETNPQPSVMVRVPREARDLLKQLLQTKGHAIPDTPAKNVGDLITMLACQRARELLLRGEVPDWQKEPLRYHLNYAGTYDMTRETRFRRPITL